MLHTAYTLLRKTPLTSLKHGSVREVTNKEERVYPGVYREGVHRGIQGGITPLVNNTASK